MVHAYPDWSVSTWWCSPPVIQMAIGKWFMTIGKWSLLVRTCWICDSCMRCKQFVVTRPSMYNLADDHLLQCNKKLKVFLFFFWHNKMSCTQWSSNVSSTMICKYMVPPKFCLCLKSKERWEIYQIFLYNCDQVTVKILLLPGSYIRLLLLHRTISPIFRDKSF